MSLPAIDGAGLGLIDLAIIARNVEPPHLEEFGTICPVCLSFAAIACNRRTGQSVAHLSCGVCGHERSARVDVPGEAVQSGAP